ncbi:TPA_asm: hypothetical protein vir519_00035 [Caudoviricetes sp. vir519]|nr:TPA_asm: hypothetical protein vir519_00035 [Caudoviricetes sp. vir519]
MYKKRKVDSEELFGKLVEAGKAQSKNVVDDAAKFIQSTNGLQISKIKSEKDEESKIERVYVSMTENGKLKYSFCVTRFEED